MRNDCDRPGVDRGDDAAVERAIDPKVRYHLRHAAQHQLIDHRGLSDEPELGQDDHGRIVMKATAPGEWLRADPGVAVDREAVR